MPDFLEQIVVDTAEMVRPPERLTVSQAAEKYRQLNNPGSYVGPWDNTIAPYGVEVMDEMTSLDYTGLIFVGPARSGKSDLFFNFLTHTAICDPADMMVVHMTQNTARDWSKGDLQKVFRHSPALGGKVKAGRQNLNTHDISFQSGMRVLVKWPTITELSGKTIPRLFLMDYDRMPLDVDKEGTPFDLARKRTTTFGRYGMTVAESSPGWPVENPKWLATTPHEAPPTPGILALYNRGDRRRWYWRCPECKTPFEPTFQCLNYPDSTDKMEAAEMATLQCPHCQFDIPHERKREMNGGGRWIKDRMKWLPDGSVVGDPIRSSIASFWLKGPAAAFADWKLLVLNYLSAYEEFEKTGSEEGLKTTVTTDQGEPYVSQGSEGERLPEDLKTRSYDLGEKVVPEGARFLIATIDVQKNRFVVQVHGIGEFGDMWIVDRYDVRKSERTDDDGERYWISPGSYEEDWRLLVDAVILKTYPLSDGSGRHMQIKVVGCDSGGREGVTANAYKFWRWLRDHCPGNLHRRFQLVKGSPLKSIPRVAISYPDAERKDRRAGAKGEVPILIINSNQVKDQVNKILDRESPGGGRVSFPDWLPDWFYTELTVEVRTAKGWENPKNQRNESWDLLCYCVAIGLSRHVNVERIDWTNPPSWAAEWDKNDLILAAGVEQRFESQPKSDMGLERLGSELA